jgi:hypothetical protein
MGRGRSGYRSSPGPLTSVGPAQAVFEGAIYERAISALIEPSDGAELHLSLARADGSRVSLLLGTGEAIALACELLQAARVRMGRADWPPRLAGGAV